MKVPHDFQPVYGRFARVAVVQTGDASYLVGVCADDPDSAGGYLMLRASAFSELPTLLGQLTAQLRGAAA